MVFCFWFFFLLVLFRSFFFAWILPLFLSRADIKLINESLRSRSDPDPINTVLMQEIDRYNILFETILRTLSALQLGIQGLSVITPELEQIFAGLLNAQVPQAWAFAYPSLKPLASWMRYVGRGPFLRFLPCLLVQCWVVWCFHAGFHAAMSLTNVVHFLCLVSFLTCHTRWQLCAGI